MIDLAPLAAGAFYQPRISQINTDFLDADFAEKYSHGLYGFFMARVKSGLFYSHQL